MICVTFSNKFILTGCKDLVMRQYQLSNKFSLFHTYPGAHAEPITISTASNDGLYIFTTSTDLVLKQWALVSGVMIKDYGRVDEVFQITCMDVGNKGRWLFTGLSDGM
jgi:WD40 repeat protein